MKSRDWHCLNEKCGLEFHSWEDGNPPCPECGCMRVSWIPGGGHIAGVSRSADKTLRMIADQHKLTNLNSPSHSRLNRAMPRAPQHRTVDGYTHHFGMGLSSPISTEGAICGPSSSPVDVRGKVRVGMKSDKSQTMPGPEANARVAARHRGSWPG